MTAFDWAVLLVAVALVAGVVWYFRRRDAQRAARAELERLQRRGGPDDNTNAPTSPK